MDVRSPDLLSQTDDDITFVVPGIDDDPAFTAFYEREIRPVMADLEAKRAAAHAEAKKRKPKAIAIAVLSMAVGMALSLWMDTDHLFTFSVFAAIAAFGWYRKPLADFERAKHDSILSKVVRFFGDFTYGKTAAIEQATVATSKIVPIGNRYESGDRISGTYQGTRIAAGEVRTERKSGKTTTTLFRGLFIEIVFPKRFHGITVVSREAGQRRIFAEAGRMETVSLEDPVFEGHFEVQSTDQVEARFLLTPDFMVRLLDLRDAWKGTSLQCSFIDDRLFISISTPKDFMELGGAGKPSDDPEAIRRVYHELRDILAVIDILKIKT